MVTTTGLNRVNLESSGAPQNEAQPEKKKIGRPRSANFYLSNGDLLAEIKICLEKDELTPNAVKMFQLIANNVVKKMHYNDPMDREDCVSSALHDLIKYWRNFNPDKGSNAFAYFTQVAKAGLAKGWNHIHPASKKGTIRLTDMMGEYF